MASFLDCSGCSCKGKIPGEPVINPTEFPPTPSTRKIKRSRSFDKRKTPSPRKSFIQTLRTPFDRLSHRGRNRLPSEKDLNGFLKNKPSYINESPYSSLSGISRHTVGSSVDGTSSHHLNEELNLSVPYTHLRVNTTSPAEDEMHGILHQKVSPSSSGREYFHSPILQQHSHELIQNFSHAVKELTGNISPIASNVEECVVQHQPILLHHNSGFPDNWKSPLEETTLNNHCGITNATHQSVLRSLSAVEPSSQPITVLPNNSPALLNHTYENRQIFDRESQSTRYAQTLPTKKHIADIKRNHSDTSDISVLVSSMKRPLSLDCSNLIRASKLHLQTSRTFISFEDIFSVDLEIALNDEKRKQMSYEEILDKSLTQNYYENESKPPICGPKKLKSHPNSAFIRVPKKDFLYNPVDYPLAEDAKFRNKSFPEIYVHELSRNVADVASLDCDRKLDNLEIPNIRHSFLSEPNVESILDSLSKTKFSENIAKDRKPSLSNIGVRTSSPNSALLEKVSNSDRVMPNLNGLDSGLGLSDENINEVDSKSDLPPYVSEDEASIAFENKLSDTENTLMEVERELNHLQLSFAIDEDVNAVNQSIPMLTNIDELVENELELNVADKREALSDLEVDLDEDADESFLTTCASCTGKSTEFPSLKRSGSLTKTDSITAVAGSFEELRRKKLESTKPQTIIPRRSPNNYSTMPNELVHRKPLPDLPDEAKLPLVMRRPLTKPVRKNAELVYCDATLSSVADTLPVQQIPQVINEQAYQTNKHVQKEPPLPPRINNELPQGFKPPYNKEKPVHKEQEFSVYVDTKLTSLPGYKSLQAFDFQTLSFLAYYSFLPELKNACIDLHFNAAQLSTHVFNTLFVDGTNYKNWEEAMLAIAEEKVIDSNLSADERAVGEAFKCWLRENLLPACIYHTWQIEQNYASVAKAWSSKSGASFWNNHAERLRREVLKQITSSEETNLESRLYKNASHCFKYMQAFYTDRVYFFGDVPSSVDATLFGILAPVIFIDDYPDQTLLNILKNYPAIINLNILIKDRIDFLIPPEDEEASLQTSSLPSDALQFISDTFFSQ